ncbi:MAG: hypothetical protein AAGD00_03985 [Planctomycetota bacterium]
MDRTNRFRAWIGVVLFGIGAPLPHILLGDAWLLTHLFVGNLALLAMAYLLLTTPSDAIKLKRASSWALVTVGAALTAAAGGPVWILLPMLVVAMMVLRTRSPWWSALVLWQPAWTLL